MGIKKIDGKAAIKWLVILVLALVCALIPTSDLYTVEMKIFLVITVVAILMLAFGLFDNPLVPSLVMIVGFTQLTDLNTAAGGFGKDAPWICISVMLLISVMNKTNLLKRLSYGLSIICGGTYFGICLGFYIIGLICTFFGNNMCLALCALACGMIKALDLEDSRASAGIMFAAFNGITEGAVLVMDPVFPTFQMGMAAEVVEGVDTTFGYGTYFVNNIAWIPFFVIFFIISVLMFKPKKDEVTKLSGGKAFFKEEKAKLGPMSGDEKKITAILIVLLIYLITNNWHGLGFLPGFLVAVIVCFIPGIKVADRTDVKNVNFAFPIFMVACIGIGSVATAVGFPEMLSSVMQPVLSGMSKVGFLVMVYIIIWVLNIFMTPMALYASMVAPLCVIGVSIGFTSVWPIVMTVVFGAMNLFLPHENNSALYMYGLGVTKMKDFVKLFMVKSILTFGWLFVMIASWSAMGLM